jgi:hypothetical protein
MGYTVARVPDQVILRPLYLSIFTAVARRGDNRCGAEPLVLIRLRGIVAVLAPIFCAIALVSNFAVPLIFGAKQQSMGALLKVMAPAGFVPYLFRFINAALRRVGGVGEARERRPCRAHHLCGGARPAIAAQRRRGPALAGLGTLQRAERDRG